MAVKPNIALVRWATDQTNNTAPSSGQRDTGWEPNQIAVSSYFNSLAYQYEQWFKYIDDGDIELNDLHVLGELIVDGNATFDSSASVGIDLDVAGDLVVSGDATVSGDFKHGSYVDLLPLTFGALAYSSGTVSTSLVGENTYTHLDTAAVGVWKITPLRVGDRVTKIKVYGIPIGAGVNPTIEIYRATANSSGTLMTYTNVGTIGTTNNIEMTLDSPFVIAAQESMHIKITGGGSGGTNIYQADITRDHP